jgi:hypothetical protein
MNRTCDVIQVELPLFAAKSGAIDIGTLGLGGTLIAGGHMENQLDVA